MQCPSDGTVLVMIEALATGTPVVATPRGSVPEIVQDGRNGFVRTDLDDLAAALGDASSLDRDECRASVEERFTAAQMAQRYVELFERLLERERGGGGAARPAVPIATDHARSAAGITLGSVAMENGAPQTA